MRYEIALSPDLGLSPGDLVDSWNGSEKGDGIAPASVATSEGEVHDPQVLTGGIVILDNVPEQQDRHALYEALEAALARKGVDAELTMTPIHQPDGSIFLTVSHARDVDER